jgi:hypothetical protein
MAVVEVLVEVQQAQVVLAVEELEVLQVQAVMVRLTEEVAVAVAKVLTMMVVLEVVV